MTTTSAVSNGTTTLADYLKSQSAAVASASTSSAKSTAANIQEVTGNFETFISILTTQLKNQDPTQAADTQAFTQQLVMYAQVEQQLATNNKLDTLITNADASVTSSLLDYNGKYVESSATTSDIVLQDSKAAFSYTLDKAQTYVAAVVTDSTGATVATLSGATTSGDHLVEWDGKNTAGTVVDDGTYGIGIAAVGTDGTTSKISNVHLIGKVTGVSLDGTDSVLYVGDQTVPLSKVTMVYDSLS